MRDLADELLHAKVKAKLFGGDHAPQLGRLRLLDRLGAGAMGTVFAAYDPRLDRKVAVKVLRRGDGAARVLAEARALAKLAHPNVVAVHDADELDGIVYIVMELAPGVPLRAWIAARRDWREVVRVLCEAGTGIAAAHAAGLVHRDIKPDNILVGDDRTRVVDFGLANAHDSADGTSAGTPFYMAPEVLRGASATAASDQFSFGVTMFEALYGKRPYELAVATTADTVPADAYARGHEELLAELCDAATKASDAPRPPGTPVPMWLHALVQRTLATEPAERFGSVGDVVAALGHDRRRRTRLIAIAVTGLAAGALAGGFAMRGGPHGTPCTGGPTRTEAAWNPALRTKVEAALGGVAWSSATLTALDGHRAAWQASYQHVCEATRVRGEQSDSLLDLRMRCLDRSLARFAALGETFTSTLDAPARAAAPSAVSELPDPARCESVTSAADLAMPSDPAARAKVASIEHDIDRAWAAFVLGRYSDARGLLAAADGAIQSIHVPRLHASERALASSIEARIGAPATARGLLDEALLAAAEANAPELEYDVWLRRLRNELFGGDPEKTVEWANFARAAAKRAGREGAEVDGIVGEALRNEGKLDAAREHLERALASKESLRPQQRALIEMNLGSVELAAGRSAAAIVLFIRARDRVLTALGDHHPELALYADKLAAANRARGRLRDALAIHDRSLALRVETFGVADRAVATSLLYRAQTRLEAGDLREARADATRARTIRETIFGTQSPRVADAVATLGDIIAASGSRDEAIAYYDHAAQLDARMDLTARRYAAGATIAIDAIPPLAAGETPSVDRVSALGARVALLVAAKRDTEARDLATALGARLAPVTGAPADTNGSANANGSAPADVDPALAYAIGAAQLAAGDRVAAAQLLDATAKGLANEPSRTALRIAIALARAAEGNQAPVAARVAISLYQAMPSLERGPVYDEMWTISRR